MNQPATQLAGRRRTGILGALQQGLTQPAPPRISIKAQRFTLVDAAGVQIPMQTFDQQLGVYIDVVIIGVNPNKSRIYYENEYDPTKDEAPTCFSDNGVAPSAQASVPQNPTCATCPNAEWGSDTSRMTGKATKLCNDRKKLAVLVVNDPSQLVYQFQIPPASLKHLTVFAGKLAQHQVTDSEGPRPCDPADVVTRIYFNPAKQGELLFQPMGYRQQMVPYVDDAMLERIDASGVIATATGENDKPYTGTIGLPNPQLAQPMALPAPAQQMQAPPPVAPQHIPQFQHQQPAPQGGWQGAPPPAAGPAFAPQPAPQQQGNPQPAAPAPRTRRGGARQGAGRPAQPMTLPTHGAYAAAPTSSPQPVPFIPQAAPQQPVPFQPQAAPPAPAGAFPDAPAFLDVRNQQPQGQPAPAPQPAPFMQQPALPAQPAFGMTNGAAPDPALSQALSNAFGAPMQPRQR